MELRKPLSKPSKKVGVYVPDDLIEYVKYHKTIAYVGTFNKNGDPRVQPVTLIYPVSNEAFLLALDKSSQTYHNLAWLKGASLSMLGSGEKVYQMKARAGVVRAPMIVHPYLHIVQLDIVDVEDITDPLIDIYQKPIYKYTSWEAEELYVAVIHELKAFAQSITSKKGKNS